MSIHYKIEQNTKFWFELKAGKISASNAYKFLGKKELGKTGKSYLQEVVGSFFVEDHEGDNFQTFQMKKGNEREPVAVKEYERINLIETKPGGLFVFSSSKPEHSHLNDFLCCSPDRLVGSKGGLEVKCPSVDKYKKCLFEMDHKYIEQARTCLFVTKRKWWDILVFNPFMKESKRLIIKRIYPDKEWEDFFLERTLECKKMTNSLKSTL